MELGKTFALFYIATFIFSLANGLIECGSAPPALVSFSISPSRIKVLQSPVSITVQYNATSLFSRYVLAVQNADFYFSNGGNTSDLVVSGAQLNTTTRLLTATAVIRPEDLSGAWKLYKVILTDIFSNSILYDSKNRSLFDQYTDENITIQVYTSVAYEPPVLLDFSIRPKKVNVLSGPDIFVLNAKFNDTSSGVSSAMFHFGCTTDRGMKTLDYTLTQNNIVSGSKPTDPLGANYRTSITVPFGTPPCNYTLLRVTVYDASWVGMVRPAIYEGKALSSISSETTLEVLGEIDKGIPPYVPAFSFFITPSAVDVTLGPANISLQLQLINDRHLDKVLIFGEFNGKMMDPFTVRSSHKYIGQLYNYIWTIPQGYPSGTWRLISTTTLDTAGNTDDQTDFENAFTILCSITTPTAIPNIPDHEVDHGNSELNKFGIIIIVLILVGALFSVLLYKSNYLAKFLHGNKGRFEFVDDPNSTNSHA